jgi:hypothetical protein
MFLLAVQLKYAYKAKHKARLAESKASFTKRRFANYIFHEVRVPLNNAGGPVLHDGALSALTDLSWQCWPFNSCNLGTRSRRIMPRALRSTLWNRG